MPEETHTSRNDALVFAAYTLANLNYLEDVRKAAPHENIHIVTQIVNSLLGLLVFVKEKNFVKRIETLHLTELAKEGWPEITITKGEAHTLGDLVRRMRNAIAHGRLKFSSDMRDPALVTLFIEDGPGKGKPTDWAAHMTTMEVRDFCVKLIERLNNEIG